jgi:hypothetical protein
MTGNLPDVQVIRPVYRTTSHVTSPRALASESLLPFALVASGGVALLGLAAAMSWVEWRWTLVALCGASVILPCGLLVLRGRLALFEPLTWFSVMFLLLFVLRPAWDLGHDEFAYAGTVISPTFTRMLVAGLLAGNGFVLGYLAPAGGALASRLPRPPSPEPRRLLVWSGVLLAIAVVAFAIFFLQAHGWRDPSGFFFRGEEWAEQLAAVPTATSKYFIASIVLVIPSTLFLLYVRRSMGTGARVGRIAGWAAIAAITGFLLYNLVGGQRHYIIEMLGALAVYHYLRRGRRPSVLTLCAAALVALLIVSGVRELREVPVGGGHAHSEQWLPWNATRQLFETKETGMAPALAAEMLVVPDDLHYTYGETTLLDPFVTLVPRQLWHGKPQPADQEVLAAVWGGRPCTYGAQCSTFSPFGAPYRDAGLVGVFFFALLFGAFWRAAWVYFLTNRNAPVALLAYSALLPFMITWMRGNFIFAAIQVTLVLAVMVVGGALSRSDRAGGRITSREGNAPVALSGTTRAFRSRR